MEKVVVMKSRFRLGFVLKACGRDRFRSFSKAIVSTIWWSWMSVSASLKPLTILRISRASSWRSRAMSHLLRLEQDLRGSRQWPHLGDSGTKKSINPAIEAGAT